MDSIPLNPIDRKSSQIFFAQNQARVLIGTEDLEEETVLNEEKC